MLERVYWYGQHHGNRETRQVCHEKNGLALNPPPPPPSRLYKDPRSEVSNFLPGVS